MKLRRNFELGLLILVLSAFFVDVSEQHARLLEPPSRASMWRVGFPTNVDEDDNQSYCGGLGVQWGRNGGRCGICGDPWDQWPRQHESPYGPYASGIIVKTYQQGSIIPIVVDITANHQGYFEFKLCPNNDVFADPQQPCFDSRPRLKTGPVEYAGYNVKDEEFRINDYVTGLRTLYVALPIDVVCDQCILQWTYVAGNNWGRCDNGTEGIGCGPQEHFRSCSDIRIVPHPLLAGNQAISTLSNITASSPDAKELTIDYLAELKRNRNNSKQKKKLLEQKRKVLMKALEDLKELILESESAKDSGDSEVERPEEAMEEMRTKEKMSKIFGPEDERWNYIDDKDVEKIPWWHKIISNKH